MAFSWYKTMDLDHTQCGSANSTDWTLTIALDGVVQAADADLKDTSNGGPCRPDGFDIRPYADLGTTPLTYELVTYDGVNGKLEMHVKIPTLTFAAALRIYLLFGDASITTNGSNAPSTYASNKVYVDHLKNGTTLSSINAITGGASTLGGAVAAHASKVYGSANFSSSSDIITTDRTALAIPLQRSWEIWTYRAGNGSSNFGRIIDLSASGSIQNDAVAPAYSFFVNGTVGQAVWNIAQPSANAWHHIGATYDGSSASNDPIFYVDGSSVTVTNAARWSVAMNTSATPPLLIGNRAALGRDWQGLFDEIVISDTILTASWILQDYNSQKDTSTFIIWGAKTAVTSAVIHKLTALGVGN